MLLLELVTINFHGLSYALLLMLPYFSGSFVVFPSITIVSSLPNTLLYALFYIFNEISSYFYHFFNALPCFTFTFSKKK